MRHKTGRPAAGSAWLRGARPLALLAWAALAFTPSVAHDFEITDVVAVLKLDGTYLIDMTLDLDALALGAPRGADSALLAAELEAMSPAELEAGIERARDTVLRYVRVRFDGAPVEPVLTFPGLEQGPSAAGVPPSVLGTTARLAGAVPGGARALTFFASRAFGPVQLTILDQRSLRGERYTLAPGEESPAYSLDGPVRTSSRAEIAGRYVALGFEHILPRGADHILFVLGLYLLSTRLAPLLWQVSAFTLAHTLTLALSMTGVLSLPSRLVESLIALSIAYVAIENLVTAELKPWRPALVFGFGLLHGLGFAGVLRELGLPENERVTALIGFNVGVELGQLAVIALAFLGVGWARRRAWYRVAVVRPVSLFIAAIGLYWAAQRAVWGA